MDSRLAELNAEHFLAKRVLRVLPVRPVNRNRSVLLIIIACLVIMGLFSVELIAEATLVRQVLLEFRVQLVKLKRCVRLITIAGLVTVDSR